MATDTPIAVNRAPVLILWAAVLGERLGHAPETALTPGRFVAGYSAPRIGAVVAATFASWRSWRRG